MWKYPGQSFLYSILFISISGPLFAQNSAMVGDWRDSNASSPSILHLDANGSFNYMFGAAGEPASGTYRIEGQVIYFQNAPYTPQACPPNCPPDPEPNKAPPKATIVQVNATTLILDFTISGWEYWDRKTFSRGRDIPAVDPTEEQPPPAVQTEDFSGNVQVNWRGEWYPATILKKEGEKYFVHYTGYESSWDEWVTRDRLRKPE